MQNYKACKHLYFQVGHFDDFNLLLYKCSKCKAVILKKYKITKEKVMHESEFIS